MKIIVNGEALEIGAPTLAALLDDLGKGEAKVATSVNEAFVAKAPPAVIEQENKRMADFTATLAKIRDQLARLVA